MASITSRRVPAPTPESARFPPPVAVIPNDVLELLVVDRIRRKNRVIDFFADNIGHDSHAVDFAEHSDAFADSKSVGDSMGIPLRPPLDQNEIPCWL